MVRVVGIDPGLAHCGVAVAEGDLNHFTVTKAFTITTESQVKKLKVHVSHDSIRRAQELASVLGPYVWSAGLVAIEGVSLPRHASSAGKLCMAFGVIAALCESEQIPLVQFSPQEVKKFFPDGKTKEPRIAWAEETYNDLFRGVLASDKEHMADAIGIAHLATRDNLYRALAQEAKVLL